MIGPPHQHAPGSHWFYNSRVLSPANLERLDPGPLTRSTSCAPSARHPLVSFSERRICMLVLMYEEHSESKSSQFLKLKRQYIFEKFTNSYM